MLRIDTGSNSKKQPTDRQKRKNVFSDAVNLYLLRRLTGNNDLPTDPVGNSIFAERDLQQELAAAIRKRILPWFWSILLHAVLLLLLTLYFLPVIDTEPLDVLSGMVNIPLQDHQAFSTAGSGENQTSSTNENETTGTPAIQETAIPEHVPVHVSPGLNFSGRDANLRAAMLGGNGGSGQTDEAVLAGLHWLVSVQLPDGSWNFSGPFLQPAYKDRENALAATAMAILAFQGFGVTPETNHPLLLPFARPLRRGWDWLLNKQNPDGSFAPILETETSTSVNHRFYTHGFCTMALCERLTMTGEEMLREPAQRSIDYCVRHQSLRSGGWRYLPDRFSDQSDVSVTGWIVLALKSGQTAGLNIPPETFEKIMKFLDSMMKSNQYMYRFEEPEPRISMTAEALLCRMVLGWERNDSRLSAGVRLILDSPPSFSEHYQRDVYYWFFATQTLYQYGGAEWQTWNTLMREELLNHQEKYGESAGSWNPLRPVRDAWGHQYGRLYTTCMSLYILEVYYRYGRVY